MAILLEGTSRMLNIFEITSYKRSMKKMQLNANNKIKREERKNYDCNKNVNKLAQARERLDDAKNQQFLEIQLETIKIDTIKANGLYSPLETVLFCHGF